MSEARERLAELDRQVYERGLEIGGIKALREQRNELAALVESLTDRFDRAVAQIADRDDRIAALARELADERVKSATYLETAKFHERNADSLARELADTRAVLEAAQRLLDETKLWLPWTPTNTFTPEVGQALQDLAAALSAGRTKPKEPA